MGDKKDFKTHALASRSLLYGSFRDITAYVLTLCLFFKAQTFQITSHT